MGKFKIIKKSKKTKARGGILITKNGVVETPAFMPVATYGTVKAIPSYLLKDLKTNIVLMNLLHLVFNPGVDLIEKNGGVHNYFSINFPILFDSGGYQTYSLKSNMKLEEKGVLFIDPRSGKKLNLKPEDVVLFEEKMGCDIGMVLDFCPPSKSSKKEIEKAVYITEKWALRSLNVWKKEKFSLFGIIQGGTDLKLREKIARNFSDLDFDGYGIGGLGLGEEKTKTFEVVEAVSCNLPEDKPRYLMGFGFLEDIRKAVELGIDLFDCVIPTRNARNGQIFTSKGVINYKSSKYKEVFKPPDENCPCPTCQNYTLSFLYTMYHQKEIVAFFLATLHNLYFYLDFISNLRQNIDLI